MIKSICKCILATMLVPVFACNSNHESSITGKIEGLQDGDTVYIACLDNQYRNRFDTLTVKDGQFVLQDYLNDSCKVFSYWIDSKDGVHQGFLFGEPGNVTMTVKDGKKVFSGGQLNQTYQNIEDSINLFRDKALAILEPGAEVTEEHIKEAEKLNDEVREFLRRNIQVNKDNLVGAFLLASNADIFSLEDIMKMISLLSEDVQKSAIMADFTHMIEQQSRTAIGQTYTDLELKNPKGESFRLSDFVDKNRITVIDFWASWCGPCMAEAPEMVKLYQECHKQGVEFIGISLDTDEDAWNKAIQTKGMEWIHGSELNDWNENMAANTYNVQSIPYTLVLNDKGEILAKGLRAEELKEFIDNYLSENGQQ